LGKIGVSLSAKRSVGNFPKQQKKKEEVGKDMTRREIRRHFFQEPTTSCGEILSTNRPLTPKKGKDAGDG